jgi:hypothetical protein
MNMLSRFSPFLFWSAVVPLILAAFSAFFTFGADVSVPLTQAEAHAAYGAAGVAAVLCLAGVLSGFAYRLNPRK